MSTALDTDIATLVGDMPAEPCEHSQHGTGEGNHDEGEATHYIQSYCSTCYIEPVVLSVCQAYTDWVLQDGNLYCTACRITGPASRFIQVLGPVGGTR